jgi:hypothetical protein
MKERESEILNDFKTPSHSYIESKSLQNDKKNEL